MNKLNNLLYGVPWPAIVKNVISLKVFLLLIQRKMMDAHLQDVKSIKIVFNGLDEKIKVNDIYFSKLSQGDDDNDINEINTRKEIPYIRGQADAESALRKKEISKHDNPATSKEIYKNGMQEMSGENIDENANDDKSEDVNNNSKMEVLAQDRPQSGRNSLRDWATVDENKYPGKQSETTASVPEVSKIKSQMAQKKAIEADINNDVRVLAGPGSGKTFIIERRYKHLVENGVKPENILVCTFGKDASTNMGQRILRTCPEANLEQISTIHAFCSRLLTKWDQGSKYYKWNVPFDWKVKSEIEGLIERIWSGEKPNVKEVLDKINLSKEQGLTVEESFQWFVDMLGPRYGHWLYKIREAFDAWLARNRFLTFTDQIYLVEQRLKNNEVWRIGLQNKFSHVIVDEAQDTTYQAMRILATVSLEPGMNTVYKEK